MKKLIYALALAITISSSWSLASPNYAEAGFQEAMQEATGQKKEEVK